MTMRKRKKNPFRISFFAVMIICCIALSVVFFWEHFAEYDISIENVAANLQTGTEAVRQAVLAHTGKLYRAAYRPVMTACAKMSAFPIPYAQQLYGET